MDEKTNSVSKEQKDNLSFEESMERLEKIVMALDAGRLDLQSSLECYEEGVSLLTRCRSILENARQRICVLRGCDENGMPVLQEKSQEQFQSDENVPGRQTKAARRPKTEKTSTEKVSSEKTPVENTSDAKPGTPSAAVEKPATFFDADF